MSTVDIIKFTKNAKEILQYISPSEIIDKIRTFRTINLKTISDSKLENAIDNVLKVKVNGELKSVQLQFSKIIGEKYIHSRFCRVRRLTKEDIHSRDFLSMKKERDAWWPPKEFVKTRGRLNKEYESLLYVAETLETALEETKIKVGEQFYYIEFRTKKPFRACFIGEWEDFEGLNEIENLKLKLYNEFLINEFSKDVGIGTEFLYRPSEIIAKKYFNQDIVQDAWCYSSVADKKRYNFCFYPHKAKECLDLVGVRFCKLVFKDGQKVQIVLDAIGSDSNGNLIYHKINSEISKKTFLMMNAFYELPN